SVNYGETWHPVKRDVLPAVGTHSCLKPLRVVWGIRSGPLVVSTDGGASYEATGRDASSSGRWSSVFVTPGRTPAEEWFWAYDPFRAGLTVGRDFETTWVSRNRGLYVDRMIRQGAVVAADACATRFFAAVNGRLYVGDLVPPDDPDGPRGPTGTRGGPVIRRAAARPAVLGVPRLTAETDARQAVYESCERLVATGRDQAGIDDEMAKIVEVARELKDIRAQRRFSLRVRVEHPGGPQAVASVTVTPDLFGLGEIALADDGKHDDGAAADGVWGGAFDFAEEKMWDANRLAADPRSPFPGTRYVPVKAVDRDGRRADWTLPLSMFFQPRPYRLACDLSDQHGYRCETFTEGDVTLGVRDDTTSAEGKVLEVKGKAGPWRAYRANEGGERDLTGLSFVTFVFRGAPGSGDVAFFLVDQLTGKTRYGGREAFEPKRFSHEVPLLAEKRVSAMDGKPQRVRIPVSQLVGPAPARGNLRFQRRHVAGFGLVAAPGAPGGTYSLSEITFSDE
ncbi:MAG TPA: choice-of-anchor X domain-containing protein, partial [Planctomycetota bacterium]|nr:choice-of-anchor X domain-containing protein [Planctomycetota bacterium]